MTKNKYDLKSVNKMGNFFYPDMERPRRTRPLKIVAFSNAFLNKSCSLISVTRAREGYERHF